MEFQRPCALRRLKTEEVPGKWVKYAMTVRGRPAFGNLAGRPLGANAI